VLFSNTALGHMKSRKPANPTEEIALTRLLHFAKLVNQTVGDALSDVLCVEAILALKGCTVADWDRFYPEFPNRLVKVTVPDRRIFTTEDAERKLVTPVGLQKQIDAIVKCYRDGRGFVRPSGTEDVVRVYAEASKSADADELAYSLAGLVYDAAGGDPVARPKEFIMHLKSISMISAGVS